MAERFRPFPPRNCRFGAPMGRCDTRTDWEGVPLEKLCTAGPAYEYDAGGAYWGLPGRGEGPVWAVWERGKGREGVAYVRATSAEKAKLAVMPENEENAE